jgi:hypothetical protein
MFIHFKKNLGKFLKIPPDSPSGQELRLVWLNLNSSEIITYQLFKKHLSSWPKKGPGNITA